MKFYKTSDKIVKLDICLRLKENHPGIIRNNLFVQSIPLIVTNDLYKVFYVTQDGNESENSKCYGIIRIYETPLIEKQLIGIEAVYASEEFFGQFVFALAQITALAEKMHLFGVHLNQNSVPDINLFRKVLELNSINGCPLKYDTICLEGGIKGIYSPFIEQAKESAFSSEGVIIFTYGIKIELNGVTAKPSVLYRGEGKLDNTPFWKTEHVKELIRYFFESGFKARLDGIFNGSLPEQILQQGFVNQPTISLTDSREVAAYYATNGHKRNEAAIFEIDISKLSGLGEIYDSYITMKKYCDWLLPDTFTIISEIVHILDVQKAGEFLNKLDTETLSRVQLFGGGSLGDSIDWKDFLSDSVYSILIENGLTDGSFRQIQDEFELFWNIAVSGGLFSTDILLPEDGEQASTRENILKPNYHTAFRMVKNNLTEAFNKNSKYGHPGWDLSPFGYIAKTIRDREFFSPASIPAYCIRQAEIVNKEGKTIDIVKNEY